MGKINKNHYDDEWILKHAHEYVRWKDMHKDYSESHPHHRVSTRNFCQHLNKRLRLTHRYTKEMDEWIVCNYPHLGAEECFKLFCDRFKTTRGFQGFKTHITDLGLNVTDIRWREACKNNGKRENVPIGTIRARGRGGNFIKVADGTDGWMPLPHYLMGKPKDGELIVHLDTDSSNDDVDNLMVISRGVGGKMTGNNYWSDDSTLTKTAIMCCQLEIMIE